MKENIEPMMKPQVDKIGMSQDIKRKGATNYTKIAISIYKNKKEEKDYKAEKNNPVVLSNGKRQVILPESKQPV